MPKETFFNLPEEKRTHITGIAIEEFGNHDFADVSISRIVARAGIAKGSFYQYFEDKEDLHTHLLDLAVQKKWELFELDRPDPNHIGVFRYLKWMAQAGVQYQIAYPGLVKVAYRSFSRNIYPAEFMTRTQQESNKFFLQLVKIGKEQGDIAQTVDDELAAFIMNTILSNLGQYIMPKIAANEDVQSGKIAFFEAPETIRIFEETLNLLESGLGKSHPVEDSNSHLAVQGVET